LTLYLFICSWMVINKKTAERTICTFAQWQCRNNRLPYARRSGKNGLWNTKSFGWAFRVPIHLLKLLRRPKGLWARTHNIYKFYFSQIWCKMLTREDVSYISFSVPAKNHRRVDDTEFYVFLCRVFGLRIHITKTAYNWLIRLVQVVFGQLARRRVSSWQSLLFRYLPRVLCSLP